MFTSMKKKMEQILQKIVELRHKGNLEQLEQSRIDPKEAMTFHIGEQNKLEDVTKNTQSKIVRPTRNCP